ncbi:MAG: hypothetical protein ABEJ98_04200 [Candidatus Nanohaloarchaea archaeon]
MTRDYRKEAFNSEIGYKIARLIADRSTAEKINPQDYKDADKGLYPSAINQEVDAAYSTVRNYLTGLKELGIINEGEKVGRRQFYEFDRGGTRKLWIAFLLHYSEKFLLNRIIVTEELEDKYPVKEVEGLIPESDLPYYSDLDDINEQVKADSAREIPTLYENNEGLGIFLDTWIDTYLMDIEESTFRKMFLDDMWSAFERKMIIDRMSSKDKEDIVEDKLDDIADIEQAMGQLKKNSFPEPLLPVYEVLELIKGETQSLYLNDALNSVWLVTLSNDD